MSDKEPIQAFPLQWPSNWKRTPSMARAVDRFGRKDRGSNFARELTVVEAVGRVLRELEHFGVRDSDVVISTNVRPTLAGLPRSGERMPDDPGAAVYWTKRGIGQRCIAVDRYKTVAGNLGAIAATLDAMRAIERHGGAEILDRAFTGFTALPSPESWWRVLGLNGPNAPRAEIEAAHRRLAMEHHPDRGGDTELMARINRARDQGMEAQ